MIHSAACSRWSCLLCSVVVGSRKSQQGKQPHCICIRKRGWKGAKSEVKHHKLHFTEAFFLKVVCLSVALMNYGNFLLEITLRTWGVVAGNKANFHNLNIKHFICHKQHLIPVTFGERFSGKEKMKAKQPRLERAPWWMSCVCFHDVRRSLHYPSRLNGFFPLPHRFEYINRGAARILWKREGFIMSFRLCSTRISLSVTQLPNAPTAK